VRHNPAETLATVEKTQAAQADEGRSGGLRLLTRDPRLAARVARSLLSERRRIRRGGEQISLKELFGSGGARELARRGGHIDPDLAFRALAYAIEPDWTAGHRFQVTYELTGEGGGSWTVTVDDGRVSVETAEATESLNGDGEIAARSATVRLAADTWQGLVAGTTSPTIAMQSGLTEVEGHMPSVTLLGRWIERADGRDGPELEREIWQRERQESRLGTWGSKVNGQGQKANGAIDPAQRPEDRGEGRKGGLLDYQGLYALWEKQNWRVHELDFSEDREQFLTTPAEAQAHLVWTLGSFYVGEERVTADLAPFLLAAPSGEVEAFLATQLVDEARHAVFFDRFAAEVMALESGDLRGRLHEIEATMLDAWRFLFDDSLRDVANRIQARPDDLELFVEGIVTYHMVTEGVLAMTGQRSILSYNEEHGLYPGFQKGFSMVERDEHRHIAFGVRFLRDVCDERPEMKEVVLRRLTELLPRAAEVFAPPQAESPREFTSYAFHSSQVYGFAYTALQRRMRAIGIEIPGPQVLMPGPIDPAGFEGGRKVPAATFAVKPS
jgi:ribonucleoside-diphosphate reductase beta chain